MFQVFRRLFIGWREGLFLWPCWWCALRMVCRVILRNLGKFGVFQALPIEFSALFRYSQIIFDTEQSVSLLMWWLLNIPIYWSSAEFWWLPYSEDPPDDFVKLPPNFSYFGSYHSSAWAFIVPDLLFPLHLWYFYWIPLQRWQFNLWFF